MKKLKPVKGYAIVNTNGQIWSPRAFPSKQEALRYWEEYWTETIGRAGIPPKVIQVLITPLNPTRSK